MEAPRRDAGSVDLYVKWSGPTQFFNNLLEVGNLELTAHGLDKEITICNLPDLKLNETRPLKFTVTNKNSSFSSQFNNLKIAVDLLKRIKVVAGILEPTPYRGPTIRDSRTQQLLSPTSSFRRSERELPFEKPANIEVGGVYTILCTHEGVKLVKSEPPSPFDVLVDEVAELQNRFAPPIMGWGVMLVQALAKKADEVCEHNTHENLQKMLKSSESFSMTTKDQKYALPMAIKILEAAVKGRKEQEDLFAKITNSISNGQYKDAWEAIPKLEIDELNTQARVLLIKAYHLQKWHTENDVMLNMISKLPDGKHKDEVLKYVYTDSIMDVIEQDSVLAFQYWQSMPECTLKQELLESLKESQESLEEQDLNTSLLFDSPAPLAPPVQPAAAPKQPAVEKGKDNCIIS